MKYKTGRVICALLSVFIALFAASAVSFYADPEDGDDIVATEAPYVEPETEAPYIEPDPEPEPETEAPYIETDPEPEPETEAPYIETEPEPETEAPYVEPDPVPETEAPYVEPDPETLPPYDDLPPAPTDPDPTAPVVSQGDDGDLTYGYASWGCVVVGIMVIFFVMISNKSHYYGGDGRQRYDEGDKITGQKHLLNDEYYNNRKHDSYYDKDNRK